jgi:ABC-2 type transport system ATP-binding protein
MIQITHLGFAYGRKPPLFKNLSLQLVPGNIYGLLGKNGAGKTTLLKIIAGALHVQSGACSVFAENPGKRTPQLLREIFFLPEDFSVPAVSAEAFVSLYAPFYPRFNRDEFNSHLGEFQLAAQDRLPSLSFGQKKKFLIAFGLASNCRLLILDEPTNGLDIPSKSQFRKLVASSLSEDKSFIISTHQVRDLEALIDPIVILDEGGIIFNHSMMDVSRKLTVSLSREEPDPATVVYSEKVLGGYTVLEENRDDRETNIDLELLFNAVIGQHEKMARLLERKEYHD